MLFKYTYLYDTGTPGQVGAAVSALDYAQVSHVVSVDAIYDVTPKLSVGGKIGGRFGSIKDTALNGPWIDSDATLAIARVDYRMTQSWDVLGESTAFSTPKQPMRANRVRLSASTGGSTRLLSWVRATI